MKPDSFNNNNKTAKAVNVTLSFRFDFFSESTADDINAALFGSQLRVRA